jgi:hypothetical protein
MTLELSISREQEAVLMHQATALGMDVAEFVMDAVQEKIAAALHNDPTLSPQEWRAKLEAIGKRHSPTGRPLDDSRESIYSDRT